MPPGRPAGTGSTAPDMKVLPPRPVGTVVSQVLVAVSNVVVATVAVGEKVTAASGTATVKFALVIVWSSTWMVTGLPPRPLTLRTLLNQTELPAAIGVPL